MPSPTQVESVNDVRERRARLEEVPFETGYPVPRRRRMSNLDFELAPPRSARMRAWWSQEPDLTHLSFEELRRRLLDTRGTPSCEKDALLAALLRIALYDSQASLAVLLCMRPALVRIAGSFGPPLDPQDVWAETLFGLLHTVERYRLDRRPQKIAANLKLDTLAHVCNWAKRERLWIARTRPVPTVGALPAATLPSGCVIEEAEMRGVLSSLEATLVGTTRLDGLKARDVALLMGMTYEAAMKRRRRAELRLASWVSGVELATSTSRFG